MKSYKVKGRSKKPIRTLKKKFKRKFYSATWKKKQLRILQGVVCSRRFVKKFTWKSQETLRKKKLIVKRRHLFQYTYKQQKHMRALRHMVKSKLPRLFLNLEKKQNWFELKNKNDYMWPIIDIVCYVLKIALIFFVHMLENYFWKQSLPHIGIRNQTFVDYLDVSLGLK